MRNSYLFKQSIGLIILIAFTFLADAYVRSIYLNIQNVVLQQLIMFTAVSVLLLLCNQFIFNYAKNNQEKFMQHKIWDKMFIVIFLLLVASLIGFIAVFFTTPLEGLIASQQWMMFVIIYYFLFLLNFFVLSIVHKVVNDSTKVEHKLLITWASSSLLIALVLFALPSF